MMYRRGARLLLILPLLLVTNDFSATGWPVGGTSGSPLMHSRWKGSSWQPDAVASAPNLAPAPGSVLTLTGTSVVVRNDTTLRLENIRVRGSVAGSFNQVATEIGPGERATVLTFDEAATFSGPGRATFEVEVQVNERISSAVTNRLGTVSLQQSVSRTRAGAPPVLGLTLVLPGDGTAPFQQDTRIHRRAWVMGDRAVLVSFQQTNNTVEYALYEHQGNARGAAHIFDLLSYNVQFRPQADSSGEMAQRAVAMAPFLSGYDGIVLQEAFDDDIIDDYLWPRLRAEYPHRAGPVGEDEGIEQDGGVYLFSRWPIISPSRELEFSNCEGADCLAEKGVLYAEIDKSGRHYHVFGTHLEADGDEARIRRLQLAEFRRFVDGQSIPTGEPVLFAGDFNIARASAESFTLTSSLVGRLPTLGPGLLFSSDGQINDLIESSSRKTIDHVLYSTRHRDARAASNSVRLLRGPEPWSGEGLHDLSDHFPVHGHFEFDPIAPSPPTVSGCATFPWQRLRVQRINEKWVIAEDGSTSQLAVFDFGDDRVSALQTLAIIRLYGASSYCSFPFDEGVRDRVGYLRTATGVPAFPVDQEDCMSIDRSRLNLFPRDETVPIAHPVRPGSIINARTWSWVVSSGETRMMNYGGRRDLAQDAINLIRQMQFNHMCFVGRPAAEFSYFRQ